MPTFTSFLPGPSEVYPGVDRYFQEAFDSGLVSLSHRSPEFDEISKRCIVALKEKLAIPEDYTVLYTSSATQCWEIIAQSLTVRRSLHYYSGSFGERWFTYARHIRPEAKGIALAPNDPIDQSTIEVQEGTEIVCLTQNETSNATQVPLSAIPGLKRSYPDLLLAYDLTSSLACLEMPWEYMDLGYASVQKGFGLPAGLGVMVMSPKAVDRAKELNDTMYYDGLGNLLKKMEKYQTNYTPNVIGIYALMRRMEEAQDSKAIHKQTIKRAKEWYEVIEGLAWARPFISNSETRSLTVVGVQADPQTIKDVIAKARSQGFALGSGYGPYKESTFRIANFPAISEEAVEGLKGFLQGYRPI